MEETAVTKEDDQDDVILRVRKNQTTENPTTPKPNAKLNHFIYNKKVYIKWFTQV